LKDGLRDLISIGWLEFLQMNCNEFDPERGPKRLNLNQD